MIRSQYVLAQDWEIINHGIAPRQLLHHLRRSSENSPTEVLSLAVGEKSLDRNFAAATGSADSVFDDTNLDEYLRIVAWQAIQASKHSSRFIVAVVGKEPSRRLGQAGHHGDDDYGKHDLECDREPPGEVGRAVQTAIIDPIRDQRSDGDHAAFDANNLAAVLRFAAPNIVSRRC